MAQQLDTRAPTRNHTRVHTVFGIGFGIGFDSVTDIGIAHKSSDFRVTPLKGSDALHIRNADRGRDVEAIRIPRGIRTGSPRRPLPWPREGGSGLGKSQKRRGER